MACSSAPSSAWPPAPPPLAKVSRPRLSASTQAWAVGERIYWDNTARQTTKVTTSNTLIGVATEVVAGGAGDVVGRVRLNGAF